MRLPLFLLLCTAFAAPVAANERLNVLFIAVDDLRPELGAYGSRAITPNIDALAASGLRFDRAYCNQAVCGASRVSLMTGLYPEYTGERSFHVAGWRERWEGITTLNQHFLENGYTATGIGKIYHGTRGAGVDPHNWTEWISAGGVGYVNPESTELMRTTKANDPGRKTKNYGPSTEVGIESDKSYPDTVRTIRAVKDIAKLAKEDTPFFLAFGLQKPHLPFNAPKKFWDLYERSSFSMPANSGKPPGYPRYASGSGSELRAYSDIPAKTPFPEFPDELNIRLIHGYHACVSYMDHNIGLLLDALEKTGEADRTIVVLWGDHGWKLGDHSSWCKHTNFESDARVPLIVRAPGGQFAKGSTRSLVELIDLYPTLCDLTGLEKPDHLQGKSFLPTLKDAAVPHRDTAYSSYPHDHAKENGAIGHSLRSSQFRYTEWWDKKSDEVMAFALTDIESDPGETTSALAGNKEEAERLSKLLRSRVLAARK